MADFEINTYAHVVRVRSKIRTTSLAFERNNYLHNFQPKE